MHLGIAHSIYNASANVLGHHGSSSTHCTGQVSEGREGLGKLQKAWQAGATRWSA